MKVMLVAFVSAVILAAGAGFLLNSRVQETADERFVGAGTELRHSEAGSNLVGKNWSGLNFPSATQ
ncbi:hypothetical protein DWF00_19715 [Bosea caraganae]|uniref:Uncharacterized protein n=1 Tax=Bosea caraganae TaxID=2763117 RepID=A0A370KXI0_9HYPH|nr:hypothetical protein [Bosea caraganae]RDJ19709.1 hypothetical protein DWE98_28480 [Bosea caraganae]RDJ24353.1 hypothetical protein DWF00_19715 [Bosea caraganae]